MAIDQTIWLALGIVISAINLFYIALQIRINRLISAASFLLQTENEFYNVNEKILNKHERQKILNKLQEIQDIGRSIEKFKANEKLSQIISSVFEEYGRVLDFFETLGLLTRRKLIPIEFVWVSYSYWILRYWVLFEDLINSFRQVYNDKSYYSEFEYLARKIFIYESKRTNKRIEQLKREIKDELGIK